MMPALRYRDNPALSSIAESVVRGDDVSKIIRDMKFVMERFDGIGLAANQIGELKRIIVLSVGGFRQTIINPVIAKAYGGLRNSREGCLSFPGERVLMVRHQQVRVEGFDENWEPINRKLNGLTAFCVQHEVDHLNGITIKAAPKGAL